MRMLNKWSILLLAFALVLVFSSTGQACPTCKEALASSGGGGDLVRGFFWSIVFMMSMPFLILSSLGTMFYLQVRRARQQSDTRAPSSEAHPLPA